MVTSRNNILKDSINAMNHLEMKWIKTNIGIIIFAFTFLSLAGCGGKKSGKTSGNASQGKTSQAQDTNLSPDALQGKKIANHNGCMNCHSANGESMVGPTFKNLYGHKTTLKDGSTITADSSYIIESMKDPKAKIAAGYSAVMPKYDFLTDSQMEYLVAYLKALSSGHSGK
jgi:cytochrome c2